MLNKAILMGRLTRDPELRHTQENKPVASFTLAIDRPGANKITDFIDVVAWEKKAEFAAQYFKKGQLVAVAGRIQTREYTDKNNNKRKAFEVVADELHFAERRANAPDNTPILGDLAQDYINASDDTLPY